MINNLQKYTFEYLIKDALSKVPNTLDKREGSIMYDALAPACYELAEYYMQLRNNLKDTYAETAGGNYLDLRVAEQGLERHLATFAVKRGIFETSDGSPKAIDIGSRFSTISDTQALIYVVTEPYVYNDSTVAGSYLLTCETAGIEGNTYTGNLLPLTYINGLSSAIMTDLIIPARDEESDDDLRARYMSTLKIKPFGGNISQYEEWVKNIDGVGDLQIYPIWDGGGTVKLSVIDPEYNIITSDFIDILQEQIDPDIEGVGLGIAPIGHKVTVTTPTEKNIDISATVVLLSGYTLGQVEPLIQDAIGDYITELCSTWATGNELNQYQLSLYIARVNSAILSIKGVANVTNTKINNSTNDLHLTQNKLLQELPVLRTVTIVE